MEIKPGYKQTEIGVIPEDWCISKLGSSFPLQRGFDLPQSKAKEGSYPVVYSNGILNFHNQFMCKAQGVVTGRSGTIGRVFFIDVDYWPHNTTLWVTSFKGNNPKFVYYLLSYLHTEKYGTGSGVPTLNRNDLHDLIVPLPPEPEQRLISSALTNIDSLITSLEKLFEKKKLIKQGVMQELLTGIKRLPGFRREWETKRLGDVSVVIMGQSPDSKYYNADSKGIPLIQGNADIQNGKSVSRIWTKSITKECQKGAILITVRAPVGSVGISSSRACLGRGVCAVQPYSVNERYLYWQLKFSEDKWNESQQGSTFTSVNSNQIKDFCILCPTSFDEQAAIADVIEDIEIEIDLHIKQLNKQILLKQAMMQELLTGRIRLI